MKCVCVLSSYDLHKATKNFIAFEDIKDIAMRLYKSSTFLRRKFCYLFRTSKCSPFELLNYSWSDKLKGVHWRAQYLKMLHPSQPQVRSHDLCKDLIPSGKIVTEILFTWIVDLVIPEDPEDPTDSGVPKNWGFSCSGQCCKIR